MIPNIDSKPTMKPFKDVSGIFVTVNFDGTLLGLRFPKYLTVMPQKGGMPIALITILLVILGMILLSLTPQT